MTQQKIAYWVIPPKNDAEFVANMEEILEVYERPYDAENPVICMDGQPVQLIKETASIFMFAEPLSGWRQATARPRRTKKFSSPNGLCEHCELRLQ
jgi:hypothetical protein